MVHWLPNCLFQFEKKFGAEKNFSVSCKNLKKKITRTASSFQVPPLFHTALYFVNLFCL